MLLRRHGVLPGVNPACAGMILAYIISLLDRRGKPRVCGDDPAWTSARACSSV